MNENELKARLSHLIAEAKADANPGYISWDAYPAGNKRFRSWQHREGRRNREKRQIRRALAALKNS